jgi:DNA-binding LacI/PurR family transcriptional regulator
VGGKMAITIKDVAKEAGVSIATVSKVINGSPSISQATVLKVNQIMKEFDYYPNFRAQNFARKSTHNVVFVTNLKKNTAFHNPYMFEIMSGLQKSLSSKNYTLGVINVSAEDQTDIISQIIAQKSTDGMVIYGEVLTKEMASLILRAGFPHVIIGSPSFESQLCWINTNNYLAGEIAVNHLIEQGYSKIAFIGGAENEAVSTHRLQGAITALTDRNIKLDSRYIKRGESTIKDGYRMMEEIFTEHGYPDCAVCANNYIALGVMKCLNDHDKKIPSDIGVVAFDDYPFSQTTDPMMSVVTIDVFDMGMQAGKLILNKIKKPNLQVQTYTTLPNLIVRGSTERL